jgi:hypothetical protein
MFHVLLSLECSFLFGFYSRDLLIEFLYISEVRVFLIIITLVSLSFTIIYSFIHLYCYLFFMKRIRFISIGTLNERMLINFSRILSIVRI